MRSLHYVLFLFIVIIYGCAPKTQTNKTSEITLNTSGMKEYPVKLSDTSINILEVIAVYSSEKKKTDTGSIPAADVFLCRFLIRPDSVLSNADTVMVLDTDLKGPVNKANLNNYWANVETSTKFKSCKINISQKALDRIKKYKYQYGKVTMVTDDPL